MTSPISREVKFEIWTQIDRDAPSSMYIEVGEDILREWENEEDESLTIGPQRTGGSYSLGGDPFTDGAQILSVVVNNDVPDMMPTVKIFY